MIKAIWERIIGNPITTLGGTGFGALFAAVGTLILQQAGCEFGRVDWWQIALLLWSGPTAVGAAVKDAQ